MLSILSAFTPLASRFSRRDRSAPRGGYDSWDLAVEVDRHAMRFRGLVETHRLFPRPPSLASCRQVVDAYMESRTVPVGPDSHLWVSLLHYVSLSLALDPEACRRRADILPLFPSMPDGVTHVAPTSVAMRIEQELPSRSGILSGIILGVGRDIATIQQLRGWDLAVIGIDKDGAAIRDLQARLDLGHSSTLATLQRGDFTLSSFMRGHYQRYDMVVIVYPANDSEVATVLNLLRPGGLLVMQGISDYSEQYTGEVNRTLQQDEFELVERWRDIPPFFRSPLSHIVPAGNQLVVLRRDPRSPVAGELFFETAVGGRAMGPGGSDGFLVASRYDR